MERLDDYHRRTVVPRWRDLTETPLHELTAQASQPNIKQKTFGHVMDAVIAEWERLPTAITATEVADAVSLIGQDPRAEPALAFLRSQQESLLPLVTNRFRNRSKAPVSLAPNELSEAIAVKKTMLGDQPRNSIGHVEIARLYAMKGQLAPAARHMEIALRVSPNSRYILRSASRLFSHQDKPEKALHFILKSDSVRVDPWIMAAEVALADLAEKSPKWGPREIKGISEVNRLSINYSELASALGVLEEGSGSHKRARKLITRSLDQPTENALAQAAWMSTKANRQYVSLKGHYQENAFEAGVFQAVHVKDYPRADRFAWNWLNDEPFSAVPAIHGSFVNCVFTRSYERALAFTLRGLLSNRDDLTLLNNKTFALLMLGNIDEAKTLLPTIGPVQGDSKKYIYNSALHGLYNFKIGKLAEGRQYYIDAATHALTHNSSLYASAISHWLENEVMSGETSREEFERTKPMIDKRLADLKLDTTIWDATKGFLDTFYGVAGGKVQTTRNTSTGQFIHYVIR